LLVALQHGQKKWLQHGFHAKNGRNKQKETPGMSLMLTLLASLPKHESIKYYYPGLFNYPLYYNYFWFGWVFQ